MPDKNNVKVEECTDLITWEKFNLAQAYPAYFQSWNWGNVEKKSGIQTNRYIFTRKNKVIGIAQVFDIRAKRGHFLHVRQGPVLESWDKDLLSFFTIFIKNLAIKRKASFIRISPLILESDSNNSSKLRYLGYRMSPIHNVDAENRWILDLNKPTGEILKEMRKTTRYMIRKGESLGIKIKRTNKLDDIQSFLDIYGQTAKLKKFVPHTLLKEEFEQFLNNNGAFLYLAEQNGKMLAGAIVTYYGKEAIYRHGATSIDGRNTPASYLLQWKAIQDASESGLSLYNFWGIAKSDHPKNPWYGLSQFKKGFGGRKIDFIHSMDLPVNVTYWFSYLVDYYTKVKKGYNH